jgi:anti-sigma factor RsiW
MSDPRTPLAASQHESPTEVAEREERHRRLATLLGAFADGELPPETASQIDAHLLGCARCRREVELHQSLRARLEREPISAAPVSLRDRIITSVAAAPAPEWENVAAAGDDEEGDFIETEESQQGISPAKFGRIAFIAIAVMILAGVGLQSVIARIAIPQATMVTAASVPLISRAVTDYRRVMQGDLPGRGRDLGAIRDAVPFDVQAIESPNMRLLAAWTTSLDGEPAAVLAYRWDDHIVLQYVVSELDLYRTAEARTAFANRHVVASRDGAQSVVAWPASKAGSLLIADAPLAELERLQAGFHKTSGTP